MLSISPHKDEDESEDNADYTSVDMESTRISLFYLQRQPFQGKNNPDKNHWFSRDVDAMAEVTGCLPILVDADAGKY